jgi:hypothetical protein
MPLEQQVLSLELAQKLKELGVKQDSLFYWVKGDKQRGVCPDCRKAGGLLPECAYCGGTGKDIEKQNYYLYGQLEVWQEDRIKDCSAFTVAELGEMLPMEYMSIKDGGDRWFGVGWGALWGFEMIKYPDPIVSNLEADCRAKILIYLLENKLITL